MTIECRQLLRWLIAAFVTSLGSSAAASPLPGPDGPVIRIPSKDGILHGRSKRIGTLSRPSGDVTNT